MLGSWSIDAASLGSSVGRSHRFRFGSLKRTISLAGFCGGCPVNAVFVARRPTGELYNPALCAAYPRRDWVLTRILWLCGMEPGRNRLGTVDSMRRYIYLHGCPDEQPMGVPRSHGCVRMRNADIVVLFDRVEAGTLVNIF